MHSLLRLLLEVFFPNILDSVNVVLQRDVPWLAAVIFFLSMLPVPEAILLGNKGELIFAPLSLLVLLLATGTVYISAILLTVWTKFSAIIYRSIFR